MEHIDHPGQTQHVEYEAMGNCAQTHNSFHV